MVQSFLRLVVSAAALMATVAAGADTPPPMAPDIRTYKRVGTVELKAHVFAPAAIENGTARAAIVLFHGGGWNAGAPEWVYGSAKRFAARGMVAVAVQYRLSDEKTATPADAMDDAKDAIRWLRANAKSLNVDVNRVVAYGVSAGGHLAATAALGDTTKEGVSSAPNAIVLYSPAVSISDSGWVRKLLMGKAKPEEISPDQLVRAGLPPAYISQGDEDAVTPYSGARLYCARMRRAGNVCELNRFSGLGHLLSRKLDEQEFDFDPDPVARADAYRAEEKFLGDRGFITTPAAPGFDSPETVVRASLAAFNARDVEAMAKCVAADFVWYNIDGGKMEIQTQGRDALRKGMQDYFRAHPSAQSEMHRLTVNGNFVSVRERATWKNKAGEARSQNAFSIYEVREGVIQRVWYYPAQ